MHTVCRLNSVLKLYKAPAQRRAFKTKDKQRETMQVTMGEVFWKSVLQLTPHCFSEQNLSFITVIKFKKNFFLFIMKGRREVAASSIF